MKVSDRSARVGREEKRKHGMDEAGDASSNQQDAKRRRHTEVLNVSFADGCRVFTKVFQ